MVPSARIITAKLLPKKLKHHITFTDLKVTTKMRDKMSLFINLMTNLLMMMKMKMKRKRRKIKRRRKKKRRRKRKRRRNNQNLLYKEGQR